MADTPIEQPIKISGAEQVITVLKSIGDAGKQIFESITGSAGKAERGLGRTEKKLKDIEKAADDTGRSIRLAADGIGDLVKGLGSLAKAAGVASAALLALTKSAAKNAEAARDGSQTLGLTTEQYGKLSYALKQSSGDIGTAQAALFRLNDVVKEAFDGTGKGAELFYRLGISARDSSGKIKNSSVVLSELAEKFKAMPDGVEKTALAMEIFGARAGPKLIPLLNEGSAGIKRLSDEAARMGVVLDSESAKLGKGFSDSLTKLASSVEGAVNAFATPFFGVFTEIADGLAEFISSFQPQLKTLGTGIASGIQLIVDVFKSTLVPAVKAAFGVFEQFIGIVNQVTGLNLDAKLIVVGAAFGLVALAVGKFVAGLLVAVPGLRMFAGILTGIPGVMSLVTGGIKLLVGSIGLLANAVRLALLVFGGWPAILIAVGVAIGYLIATYLQSGLWQQHLQAIVGFFSDAWESIKSSWAAVGEAFNSGWETLKGYFQDGVDGIANFFSGIWQTIVDGWNSAIDGINQAWETVKTTVQNVWNEIVSFIMDKINRIKNALGDLFGGAQAADGGLAIGAASGGYIRGPGTGTSDSIPAWLSDGEFVQRTKAVKYYGVDFMRALNGLRIPKDMFGGFADGGLVGSPTLAPVLKFADGGPASLNNILNLSLDGEQFNGLRADDDTMDRLKKRAIKKSLSPRKPNWVK